MGVYDITEEVKSAISANFATKLGVVATAKSKTLVTSFTLYDRERAETFWKKTLPGVGLWVRSCVTGSERVRQRKWASRTVIDYMFKGNNRTEVIEQSELALDGMVRVIDDLATTGTILAAGEGEFNTDMIHDIDDLLQESAGLGSGGPYYGGFRMEVPIIQQDDLQ